MSICETSELDSLLAEASDSHENDDLIILYTTMNSGPGVIPEIVKESKPAYIPKSIFFDFQNVFVDKNHTSKHMMPSMEQFQSQVRNIGVNSHSTIVVYDDFGNFCASRVWFMFKSMGHENIHVLNGGLPKWLKENRKTTERLKSFEDVNKSGGFNAKPSSQYRFLSKQQVIETELSEIPFFDARSNSRFVGNEETRQSRSEGHIPGMHNLHYRDVQNKDGTFLSPAKLDELFPVQSPIGFSCGSGVTACILAQAAALAGREELLVYDGSWSEWSADIELPIA